MVLAIALVFTGLSGWTGPAAARAPANASTLQPIHTRQTFTSRDGLELSYVHYPVAAATARPIVISPGCGESAFRYEALVDDLLAKGYGPIYILEHRGQGFSEGSGRRSDLVHVAKFDTYVTDFTDFVRGPVASDLKLLGITTAPDLIAHSMGGAIANLALHNDPTLARRVAYVAPMMDINTTILNPMHDRVALWAAQMLCAAGLCERLAIGMGSRHKMALPGVRQEIESGVFRGGVSPGWLKESIRATGRIRRQARDHAEPTLMITARRDRLVENKALRAYAAKSQNCSLLDIDGPHGLHQVSRTRAILVNAIDTFFTDCDTILTH